MKKLFFLLCLLMIAVYANAADFSMNENCRKAYKHIQLLEFEKASQLISQERSSNPENKAVEYLDGYMEFLKAFIDEQESDFIKLKHNIEKRLNALDEVDDSNPWKQLARSEIILQTALVKLKWKEYLTSAYQLRRSYRLLEENKRNFPDFPPNLKCLGFFHAVIGGVPENYKWMANIAGMKGTISQGADELNKLLYKTVNDKKYSYLYYEAAFLNAFIATHFEKNYQHAEKVIAQLSNDSIPKGPLQHFIIANTYMSSGKSKSALTYMSTFTLKKEQYIVPYLDYLTGLLKLNALDLSCEKYFLSYVNNFKGNSFVKSTYQKLAWISFLKKDTANYFIQLAKIGDHGNDFTDEDKQAQKEFLSKELPNYYLLRARLFFDGTNYTESLQELAGKQPSAFPRLRDQLEFTYRLARIFDKTGQDDKALKYYNTTFENGDSQPFYFAANSALNTAIIFEEKGNKEMAINWYKKCLALRNHEYQNSIDQKAEAGLDRLSE